MGVRERGKRWDGDGGNGWRRDGTDGGVMGGWREGRYGSGIWGQRGRVAVGWGRVPPGGGGGGGAIPH